MKALQKPIVTIAAAGLFSLDASFAAATPTSGELVTSLVGRWAGQGEALYKDGKHEPFKCVVTYFTDHAGNEVKQIIRCNSESLDLNLESAWKVSEGSITGTWRETKYELKGTLLGSLDPEGYNLYAENEFANATISVRTSSCSQDVVMKFSKEVDLLTAKLKKC